MNRLIYLLVAFCSSSIYGYALHSEAFYSTAKIAITNHSVNNHCYSGFAVPFQTDTTKEVLLSSDKVPQKPLFELFTASTCPYCYTYNISVQPVLDANYNNITYIKYPYRWFLPGDPYHTDEIFDRGNYYGVPWNPYGIMNGTGIFSGSGSIPNQNDFNNVLDDSTYVDISVSRTITGHKINMNITITPYADYATHNYQMFIAIYEKRTVNNATSNGLTEFFHVVKKMVPDDKGYTIDSLKNNVIQQFSLSYNFNGSYRLPLGGAGDPIDHTIEHSVEDFNALDVAVWIQDTTTYNVIQSGHSDQGVVSIKENILHQFTTFPNPARDHFFIDLGRNPVNSKISLISINGQMLLSQDLFRVESPARIDVSTLPRGMYVLKVESDQYVSSKVIILQ